MNRKLVILAAWLTLLLPVGSQATQVGLIKVNGAIGPATASYIGRAIDRATAEQFQCLIIQLDTPGGLLASTEEIKQDFYASQVPIVVFVAPSGAAATSAGTFITMAADVAVMAPNTRIGAAHPVSLLGLPGGETTNDIMRAKSENDTATSIRNIAEKRGRNANWAESAVRESASITSEQALATNVIDFIAKDMPDLLKQLDGRVVNGKKMQTAGATVVEISMKAWERFARLFLRPEVMFILMLVVMYGIIGELSHPGSILPGVAGAIALILVLYMSSLLPINVTGLVLIGLAIALFIIDVFAPTHGVLTVGGIVAFFLGAMMLFSHEGPGFRLSLGYIIPATLLTAAFFIFVVGAGLRAQFLPKRAGSEAMLGRTVNAISRIDNAGGKVFIEGEYWNAVSDVVVEKDQPVEVVGIEGLTLKVKPKTQ